MDPSYYHEPKTSWDLLQVTMTTQEWIKKARDYNVDIEEEVHKIDQTIVDAPEPDPTTHLLSEVAILQQLMLQGMYCSRIIRKLAKAEIQRTAEIGRANPQLQSQIWLINDCERWALSQLPSEWCLGDPTRTIHKYYALKEKINEMTFKVCSR